MKNRKFKKFLEKKAFFLVLALCLLSAAGMYGIYRMEVKDTGKKGENTSTNLVDLNEMTKEQELAMNQTKEAQDVPEILPEDMESTKEMQKEESSQIAAVEYEESEESEQVMAQGEVFSFSQSENIKWPVKGNIILDYSPDSTVYFVTLEQYRCNPAVLIQAEAGTAVQACADGKVKEITQTEELGQTLTLDLGNGYEAVYGQLGEIKTTSGATVKAGEQLAVVAAPSRYYVVEGSNLYFQMLKDGESINPRAYLE